MTANQFSVETVKALVAEFFNHYASLEEYSCEEYYISETEFHFCGGSYAHKAMEGVYCYANHDGVWYVHNTNTNKWYYFSCKVYDIHGMSYLWEVEVQSSDEHATTDVLIVAPTQRVAELEGKYSLLDGNWGPREVFGTRCVASVNGHLPDHKAGYHKAMYV